MRENLSDWSKYWEKDLVKGTPLVKDFKKKELEFFKENIPKGASVFEAGCGEGRVLKSLSEKASFLAGIDINNSLVEKAREKFKGNKHVEFFCENMLKTHFADSIFDYGILSMNTLGNLGKNKVAALVELKRILKNNGKIFIVVYSEKALEERIRHYTDLYKFEMLDKEKGKVKLFCSFDGINPITTEQFSKKDLEDLFTKAGFAEFKIEPLNEITYICTVAVKK